VSRSASRCNAGTFLLKEDFCVFPTPSRPAQRAAGTSRGGFEPERRPVPRHSSPRDRSWRHRPIPAPQPGCKLRRLGRAPRRHQAFSDRQGGLRRQRVPYGPTRDAPDYVADRTTGKTRDDAEQSLRLALGSAGNRFAGAPAIAFRPFPHPRIRWTVASPVSAVCAHGHTRPSPPRVTKCRTKC